MKSIDTIIIVVVLVVGALGIYWGFIRQVLALAGLIAGVIVVSRYGARVAGALASLLRRFVGLLFLGWLDHLIGWLLGVLQGLFVCTIGLLIAAAFPLALWTPALSNSQFAPLLVRAFGFLLPLL